MTKTSLWKLGQTVRALAEGVATARDHDKHDKHACGCCDIPETACPPRCAGEVEWTFARGAAPEASVVVRNIGEVARTFAFSATELAGPEPGSAVLQVTPASTALKPGESTVVRVRLESSASLRACQVYRAEILIKGSWEQCVAVLAKVQADPFDRATVEQGDSFKSRLHAKTSTGGIAWKIERGVTPEAAMTVHNVGTSARSFHFEPTPVVGAGGPGASITVAPDSLQLGEGQTGVVRVKLQNSQALDPGQKYEGALLIRGFHEQRVAVALHVTRDPAAYVEVEQGEAPTRRRAHHWYDHFQCTDACAPGAG